MWTLFRPSFKIRRMKKKIAVVCAPGVGDAVILHIASHHLSLANFDVVTVTPHRFGNWLPNENVGHWTDCDEIFLQHDNSQRASEIQFSGKPVYTFYGSHRPGKHPPLKNGYDFVCDLGKPMVDNVVACMKSLFSISATNDNGFRPPKGLHHRKYLRRVVIHSTSGDPDRNWPLKKFEKVAKWLERQGYEPFFLPQFPSLEELLSFIYESGFFLGNDSGPGHIASLLKVPHIVVGREKKHMHHWRPGWGFGEIIVPPDWALNLKGLRLRETHWKSLITTNRIIKCFKNRILQN